MKKFIAIIFIIIAIVAIIFFVRKNGKNKQKISLTPVKRGAVTVKALAIGQIVPKHEISIKSKIRGIVKKRFVKVGGVVKKGDPLTEVDPDPTPLEFTRAKRQMELCEIALTNSCQDYERAEKLYNQKWISDHELENIKQVFDEKKLEFKLAQENFHLISKGKIELADKEIDNVIKSPVEGTILELLVDEGDPVVPLTTYQEGTPLMTIADMKELIFKGTVDEIDIGKIEEGVSARLIAGALPDFVMEGIISEISPKAKREENTTLFDIEIKIISTNALKLRAGYSATAEIIIDKTNNVLTIPERLIFYSNDMSYVEVQLQEKKTEIRLVKTKLSDGITTEIEAGLKENEKVIERPPKEKN